MGASLLDLVILGIVEGLTEFLPVSSTGHLILASELLGYDAPTSAAFKIAIQLGAILAVLVAYQRRFRLVLGGLVRADPGAVAFTRNILLGFAPALVIGYFAYDAIRALLENPQVVAWALILGGVAILLIERRLHRSRFDEVEEMTVRASAGVGLIQCIAMIPGVSRSGATIMGGLLLGLNRKTAAEFSFFLAVPTMLAATVFALWKSRAALDASALGDIAVGFTVAFVVALAVVKSLVAIVSRYGFAPFAWYRIVVGSAALIWLAWR